MTDDHALQTALNAVDTDAAADLVRRLVDVPSPTGHERECAVFLREYMRKSGVSAYVQDLDGDRANVVAAVEGTGGGPTLMLNGHLDTTQYGDEGEDYAANGPSRPNDLPHGFEVDGALFGLGAFNMKGGVAAAFLAVRALKTAGVQLAGTVLAGGVAGESEKAPVRGVLRTFDGPGYRGGGYGTRALLMHSAPIDYAIVAEPSDLYVVNAQSGYLSIKVSLLGKSSYLSVRGLKSTGGGTLFNAFEIAEALRDWGDTYMNARVFDTGMGLMNPQLTLGAVEGGWPFFPSISPAACNLYVNLRLTPVMQAGEVIRDLNEVLRSSVARCPALQYKLEVFASNAPSTITPADSLLVQTAIQVMEQEFGLETRRFAPGEADPSNDTNIFRRHGIPAIKCGPRTRLGSNTEKLMHTHGIHVHRDDVVAAAKFYIHMAFELCGKERS